MPDTSYATRAKLTMDTPDDASGWLSVNERVRVMRSRQHLLVSNTGPKREGYTYCTKCGRIEASTDPSPTLIGPHPKPYPDDDHQRICDGISPTRHVVLGTDFITDIALFSMRVAPPLSLKPSHSSTAVALRTISEALAKAASLILELEPGEVMAEYRPALTQAGTIGLEAEVFLYDTLPGGAGFSTELAESGTALLRAALHLMTSCPENCDASCYRCLRSFKNKLEHSLLDRHVGAELLQYLLTGKLANHTQERLNVSTALLYHDLRRHAPEGSRLDLDGPITIDGSPVIAPILARAPTGHQFVVALASPLTPGHASDPTLAANLSRAGIPLLVENELVVRRNLPAATRRVIRHLRRHR